MAAVQKEPRATRAQIKAVFTKSKAGDERDFLFCIPIQVGPPTPYAKNVVHWIHSIVLLQVIILVLRILVLWDVTGGLWMALIIGLAVYAIYHDLNITYVCCWGLACGVEGVVNLFGLIMPFLLPVFPNPNFIQIVIKACIPLASLTGALLARHLYHDYAHAQGLPTSYFSEFDPLGHYVDNYDLEEKMPLLTNASEQAFQQAEVAAAAGATAASKAAVDAVKNDPKLQASVVDQAKASLFSAMTSGQTEVEATKQSAQRGLDTAALNANAAGGAATQAIDNAAVAAAQNTRAVDNAAVAAAQQLNSATTAANATAQSSIQAAAVQQQAMQQSAQGMLARAQLQAANAQAQAQAQATSLQAHAAK